METTEKIVEAYVRYVKGWLTIPNIKCEGQLEIDLLAVDVSDPARIDRYHIESGVFDFWRFLAPDQQAVLARGPQGAREAGRPT
ncbi:MAG: hypothetical protein QN158_04805 [Armatimonadota bacterium]|nr:hypothetical protein [Armatimonadota bacterium]